MFACLKAAPIDTVVRYDNSPASWVPNSIMHTSGDCDLAVAEFAQRCCLLRSFCWRFSVCRFSCRCPDRLRACRYSDAMPFFAFLVLFCLFSHFSYFLALFVWQYCPFFCTGIVFLQQYIYNVTGNMCIYVRLFLEQIVLLLLFLMLCLSFCINVK